ncbi:ComEC/Rec2 family competence protein [Bacillus sp. FJAT-45066]|uniref:ComEC/Rec2 family competence protein n=1 Tax=Bacillus sp. FJAT-45066 TaxID=2011010 RepID=UPI001596D3DF|nr:MBL fold metallo-hydrolase [Bacillus sp. FJAT-45066]
MSEKWSTTIDFLNVGFGSCTVINYYGSERKTIIIDGGDDYRPIYEKPGRKSLLSYVEKNELPKIDLLLITHPHPDHINGLVEVLKSVPVDEVWTNISIPSDFTLLSENHNMNRAFTALSTIYGLVEREKIKFIYSKTSYRYETLELTALPPCEECVLPVQLLLNRLVAAATSESAVNEIDRLLNRISIPSKVNIGDISLLFGAEVQESHWDRYDEYLPSTIFLLPHHGDIKHMSSSLLEKVGMKYAVVSADDEGTYELPSKGLTDFMHQHAPETTLLFTAYNSKAEIHEGVRFTIECCETGTWLVSHLQSL